MNLNSEVRIPMSETEAKRLWNFLEERRKDLDEGLLPIVRRLETELWDRMTIDELQEEHADE
jgi:hypothetical protein